MVIIEFVGFNGGFSCPRLGGVIVGQVGAKDSKVNEESHEDSGIINYFGIELEDVDGDKLVGKFFSC